MSLICHLFPDNLAIVISAALENRFSKNIVELERQVEEAMNILANYADNNLIPVNTKRKSKRYLCMML